MTDTAEQCIICLENLHGGSADPSTAALPVRTQASNGPEPVLVVAPLTTTATATAAATGPNPAPLPTTEPDSIIPSADLQSDTATPTSSDCEDPRDHNNANNHNNPSTHVAILNGCGHQLHNECLQAWTAKANSCPICRQSFNIVNVYDHVGGTQISTYCVEDKKQTVEWDPTAWLFEEEAAEEPEPGTERDARPCVVCQNSNNEEVLLLCDHCDTPYHTHCIGLQFVPRGEHWYCMECEGVAGEADPEARYDFVPVNAPRNVHIRSHFFPRTRGTMRRARRHAHGDPWRGAWGQFTESVYEALELDLDYHDTDDDDLEVYRRSQQLRERELREYQRWQQRLSIATRAGARDVFRSSLPPPHSTGSQGPERPRETREELQSWGALEKAKEDSSGTSSRKRKASPDSTAQSSQQPERKLKRPRTKRVPQQQNIVTAASPALSMLAQNPTISLPIRIETQHRPRPAAPPSSMARPQPAPVNTSPTFLSSLLHEIKQHPRSDEGNVRGVSINGRASYVGSSPASSPPPSVFSSPTMPTSPQPVERPISPILPLSSYIEPNYPPANYRPIPGGRQNSDSEVEQTRLSRKSCSKTAHRSHSQDILAPRGIAMHPASPESVAQKSSERRCTREGSPVLPLKMKESITCIVRGALKPHWGSKMITSQQYEAINRDVSRKLYNEAVHPGRALLNNETKQLYERIATREVERAVTQS